MFIDLHIHSHYSKGSSIHSNLRYLEEEAKIKGLSIIGTGDFLHSLWFEEIKKYLIENPETGLHKGNLGIKFMLTCEICNYYVSDGKLKTIHNIICVPSFEDVAILQRVLSKYGDLSIDGRPTLYLNCERMVGLIKDLCPNAVICPAHIWTPHYSLLGANHGFDSVKECFGSETKHIFCLETGLSSDPLMNWQVDEIKNYSLISNSDAHSTYRIGREAFSVQVKNITFNEIFESIKKNKDLFTIEYPPELGKYHYSGHRHCNFSADVETFTKLKGICPKCGKRMVAGVAQRIATLANVEKIQQKQKFIRLIPLSELLGVIYSKQKIFETTAKLLQKFGTEYNILMNANYTDILRATNEKVAKLIVNAREGKLKYLAGYDGTYGKILMNETASKKSLFDVFGGS